MAIYRVICLDSGRIVERCQYEADSDSEALRLFDLRQESTDCELWRGTTRIALIPKGCRPILVE